MLGAAAAAKGPDAAAAAHKRGVEHGVGGKGCMVFPASFSSSCKALESHLSHACHHGSEICRSFSALKAGLDVSYHAGPCSTKYGSQNLARLIRGNALMRWPAQLQSRHLCGVLPMKRPGVNEGKYLGAAPVDEGVWASVVKLARSEDFVSLHPCSCNQTPAAAAAAAAAPAVVAHSDFAGRQSCLPGLTCSRMKFPGKEWQACGR
eukprot:1159211-Pelagomonas_calceolata.AAC.16